MLSRKNHFDHELSLLLKPIVVFRPGGAASGGTGGTLSSIGARARRIPRERRLLRRGVVGRCVEAELPAALRLPIASPSRHDGRCMAWPRVGDVVVFFP